MLVPTGHTDILVTPGYEPFELALALSKTIDRICNAIGFDRRILCMVGPYFKIGHTCSNIVWSFCTIYLWNGASHCEACSCWVPNLLIWSILSMCSYVHPLGSRNSQTVINSQNSQCSHNWTNLLVGTQVGGNSHHQTSQNSTHDMHTNYQSRSSMYEFLHTYSISNILHATIAILNIADYQIFWDMCCTNFCFTLQWPNGRGHLYGGKSRMACHLLHWCSIVPQGPQVCKTALHRWQDILILPQPLHIPQQLHV